MTFPVSVNTQTKLAELIAQKFNIRCERQDVNKWVNHRNMPDSVERFPKPINDWYNVEACFEWVKKWIIKRRAGNVEETQQSRDVKKAIDENKCKLLEMRVKREQGMVVSRAVAERVAIGELRRLHATYRSTDEHVIPIELKAKLQEHGVTMDASAKIMEWFTTRQQSLTTQRETAFQAAETAIQTHEELQQTAQA